MNYFHCREESCTGGPMPTISTSEIVRKTFPLLSACSFFLRQGELFCQENRRAIENSSVSREYKFSNELLEILQCLTKIMSLKTSHNCCAVRNFSTWNGKSVFQLSLKPPLLTTLCTHSLAWLPSQALTLWAASKPVLPGLSDFDI